MKLQITATATQPREAMARTVFPNMAMLPGADDDSAVDGANPPAEVLASARGSLAGTAEYIVLKPARWRSIRYLLSQTTLLSTDSALTV